MRCYVHPDREAEAECSICHQPICSECAAASEADTHICSRCQVLHAAREADEGIHERVEETSFRKYEKEEKEKKVSRLKYVLPLVILGLAALAAGLIYFRSAIPPVESFEPSENPVAAAVVIDQAIKDYAEDHNGRVPDDLGELKGKYLPRDVVQEVDIEMYDFSKSSSSSYELRPRLMNIEGHPEISFTEKGVKTGPDDETAQ